MPVLGKSELYIADPVGAGYPHAPTGRLLDFADRDCDPDALGFSFLDAPAFDDDTFQSVSLGSFAHDGDAQAAHRHRDRVLQFSVVYNAKPIAEIVADLQTLSTALSSHGVLVWQLRGTEEPLYFDFRPSPIPQMLRGQAGGVHRLVDYLTEANGIPIRFICHPWPRSAPVEIEPATVGNDPATATRCIAVTNPGNMPGEVEIVLDPDAGNLAGARLSWRSSGNMTEYPTLVSAPASDADFSDGYDTAADAVADATAGSAAVIDFATVEEMVKRFRDPRVAADPDSLRGVHLCYARLVPTDGATRGKYNVQLRYGFTTDPYAMQTRPKVPLDFRDVSPQNFVDIYLGLVAVPANCDTLNLDFYAQRLSGDYSLAVDQLILEPAEWWHAHATVPGHRLGSWSRTSFDPDELEGDGILRRDTYRINAIGDVAETPALPLAAGIHAFELVATLREPDDPTITDGPNPVEQDTAEFHVWEDTGGTSVKHVDLRNRKDRRWTEIRRAITFEVSAADVLAGKTYRARVTQTATTLSGRRTQIHVFRHRFIRALTSSAPLEIRSNLWLDGRDRGAQVVDGAGAPLFPMVLENEPPLVPPGDSVLVASLIDLPTDAGYAELDEREPVGRSVLDRQAEVSVVVTPRWSHP